MPKYFRHSKVDIAAVLASIRQVHTTPAQNGVKPKAEFNGVLANVRSLRLRTFLASGVVCKCCGLEATHFALERNYAMEQSGGSYHLNLWGVDAEGGEVLFTHDHILARSLGGADNLSNTQTMCGPCNWEKGISEGATAGERRKIAPIPAKKKKKKSAKLRGVSNIVV